MKRIAKSSVCIGLFTISATLVAGFNLTSCSASAIKPISATGWGTTGHDAEKVIDSDYDTYFETNPSNKDDSFRRYVDIQFDAVYHLSTLTINQFVPNSIYENTFNHYEVYAGTGQDDWTKIAFKTNDNIATCYGETYNTHINCSQIRINLSFNSQWKDTTPSSGISGMSCPLTEVSFSGYYRHALTSLDKNVNIDAWQNTVYYTNHNKFINDASYREQRIKDVMSDMVGRVLGNQYRNSFNFRINNYKTSSVDDTYTLSYDNHTITITGNNANSLASGLNYYLKHYCNTDYNPLFSTNPIKIAPNNLPTIDGGSLTNVAHYNYRYALNYCTYSYTMAFWRWEQWQSFLDWAVMNSINLMLDMTGQEEVIRETLMDFNYSDEEAREYIAGPAYQAWFMMGNMTGFGGTLSSTWLEQRVSLARMIHERMETYSITPIMQGFIGSVPDNFDSKNSNTPVFHANKWCGFEHVQNLINSSTSSGKNKFNEVFDKYYLHQKYLFGDLSHFLSADPFHERSYSDTISDATRATVYINILEHLRQEVGSDVIWLMQQWQGSVKKNDLQAIKDNGWSNNVLVLDLYADIVPMHDPMEQTSTPWIWTMINNFGGRMGIFGQPENLIHVPKMGSTGNIYLSGIGIAPESFGNSPVIYETLLDTNYMDPDSRPTTLEYINQYIHWCYGNDYDYTELGVGSTLGAWHTLLSTAYNPNDITERGDYQGAPESVFNARPKHQISVVSTWGGTNLGYDASEFSPIIQRYINAYIGTNDIDNSPNFIYDFVDVARQHLQNKALDYLATLWTYYSASRWDDYQSLSNKFLDMIRIQDKILTKIATFNAATWIYQARNMWVGISDWDKDLNELNARALISTWGYASPANLGQLHDYSNRQWSGLTSTLYLSRWQRYFDYMNNKDNVNPQHQELSTPDWFKLEWEWANRKSDEGYAFDGMPNTESLKTLAQYIVNNF